MSDWHDTELKKADLCKVHKIEVFTIGAKPFYFVVRIVLFDEAGRVLLGVGSGGRYKTETYLKPGERIIGMAGQLYQKDKGTAVM